MIGKGLGIHVLETARFDLIPAEFLPVAEVLIRAGLDLDVTPTITGVDRESYRSGGAHQAGYAWDVRVFDVTEPSRYAVFIRTELRKISKNYVVLYGDQGHLDHIHIHWQGANRMRYFP
jgi:hypothetical protein